MILVRDEVMKCINIIENIRLYDIVADKSEKAVLDKIHYHTRLKSPGLTFTLRIEITRAINEM